MPLAAKPYLREVSIDPDAEFDTGQSPFSIPAVRALGTLALHPDVTFFVGENGAGKSTLLEAIAVGMGRAPARPTSCAAESLFNVISYRWRIQTLKYCAWATAAAPR
jgi:hypothetical protein